MPKFADIQRPALRDTTIPEVKMTDLDFRQLKELEKFKDNPDERQAVLWMFKNLFRSPDGEPFEDVVTLKDVDKVSVLVVAELSECVKGLLAAGGKA